MGVRRFVAGMAAAAALGTLPLTPALAGDGGGDAWGSLGISSVAIGGGAFVMPKYEGSHSYRVIGAPLIIPQRADGTESSFDVQGVDDVRWRLFRHGGFEAGPLAGWRFGREESDGRRLRGLGDVDGGLVVGGYMAYNLGLLKPFVSYHYQVTGDDSSGVLRLGSEAKFVVSRGFELTGTAGASYGDDNYMRNYFGISTQQSLASTAGLAAYDADAGFKDVFIGATAEMALTDRWTLYMTGRYARLIGDAADSPVVESANQWTAGLGLTYRVDLR
jgi:outer membrane scaffolding protein for murein synthesis (MipA/OmpV family)